MSSLAISVGYCGFESSDPFLFHSAAADFSFKSAYINGGAFFSLHFVLHSAFNSL